MATYVENLIIRRDAVAQKLADMSESNEGFLPNTSGDGINVDMVGLRKSLLEELKQLNEEIRTANADDQSWEIPVFGEF